MRNEEKKKRKMIPLLSPFTTCMAAHCYIVLPHETAESGSIAGLHWFVLQLD